MPFSVKSGRVLWVNLYYKPASQWKDQSTFRGKHEERCLIATTHSKVQINLPTFILNLKMEKKNSKYEEKYIKKYKK